MRRLELLIAQSRQATENNGNSIPDSEFIQYFNDAQDSVQTIIYNVHPETDFFSKEGYIDLISNQEAYSLNDLVDVNGNAFRSHIYAQNSISLVERTEGNSYYPLKLISNKERRTGFGYIIKKNEILMAPTPASPVSRGIRLWYAQKLPRLDIRRCQVNGAPAGNVISFDNAITGLNFNESDGYLSVVDKNGVILASDLEIESFTGASVTVSPYLASDINNVVDDAWIVFGKWATTHSQLPDTCERYLLMGCERRIFSRDSSSDQVSQVGMLQDVKEEIANLFADNIDDVNHVPISSTDYLNY